MRLFRIMFVATLAVILGACASAPKRPAMPVAVGERAVARWQALIDGKPDLAYDYLTAGVRSTKTREVYVQEASQKPVQYRSVKPVADDCEADSCTVTVELEYEVRLPVSGVGNQRLGAFLEERWIRLDGAWYYLPDEFR